MFVSLDGIYTLNGFILSCALVGVCFVIKVLILSKNFTFEVLGKIVLKWLGSSPMLASAYAHSKWKYLGFSIENSQSCLLVKIAKEYKEI